MSVRLPEEAFVLPEHLAAIPGLQAIYEAVKEGMLEDLGSNSPVPVPLTMPQTMLMERIAYLYVLIKYLEARPIGTTQSFTNMGQFRDATTMWLSLVKEFQNSVKNNDTAVVEQIMAKTQTAMSSFFEGMHEDVARPLKAKIAKAFADQGL